MKKLLSTFLVMAVAVVAMFSGAPSVNAGCAWDGIPLLSSLCGNGLANTVTGNNAGASISNLVKNIFIVFFVLVIGVAVFYVLRAALKYIRSEGDEKKVEQAKQAVKSILMGVAAIFVGVLGIVIILTFFTNPGTEGAPTAIQSIIDCFKNGTCK